MLEKLQEVTLPAPPPPKISKKKDHEKKKKEKKKKDETPVSSASALPVLPSITEVIKEGFIQRAKQDLQVEAQVKTKTKPDQGTPPHPTSNGDDFDIPTITDIAKEAVEKQQHQQLEELQKKIYMTKKQLQTMVSDESDDDFNVSETLKPATPPPPPSTTTTRTGIHVNPKFFERNERIVPNNNNNNVQERLGTKATEDGTQTPPDDAQRRVVKLSAVRRAEREIYVPAFRRAEMEKHRTNQRQDARDRERRASGGDKREPLQSRIQIDRRIDLRRRSRENSRKSPIRSRPVLDRSRIRRRNSSRHSRSRSTSPVRRRKSPVRSRSRERRPFLKTRLEVTTEPMDEPEVTRKRVGSRVFVMPPRPPSEEGDVDVPVNSVIKIKPRAHVPENKQASKMLLLRAVAEAQKSTFGSIPARTEVTRPKRSVKDRLTIEVANDEDDELDMTYDDIVIDEDEYVPAPVSKTSESESDSYLYIPKKKAATRSLAVLESDEYDPDDIKTRDNTKFVVTLDSNDEMRKTPPPVKPVTTKKRSVKERIGYRMQIDEDEEAKRRRKERFEQGYERIEENSKQKSPSPQPPPVVKRIFHRQNIKSRSNTPQDRRHESKSPHHSQSPVFRNRSNERKSDFWGDAKREEAPVHHRHRSRARTISPINFDLTDEETRSRSSHEGHSDEESRKENRRDGEPRPKIKKLEPTRKFDNVPSCEYFHKIYF